MGMMRTVIPALAETEFGVARGSFLLLTAFVVAFGVVKAVMNFVAGRLSERIGRKRVLLWGWIIALPIPVMIWAAPNWGWIVAATVLLGVNQGLCWSMTQTAKLDITRADQRGLTMGLNEFSGYVGVALAGVVTAYAAEALGARLGLLIFGMTVIVTALVLTVVWVKDTLPWAKAETAAHKLNAPKFPPRYPQGVSEHPTTAEVFALMSRRDKRLAALSQAGVSKKDPFKYFHSSREIIRLAVMMYVRFPLSLRNVEDLLHERGIDISHETVRFWWLRFGPMFAAEI